MKIFFNIVALCLLVALCGCGSSTIKTAPVEGTVTMDGSPLANASIQFYPVDLEAGKPGYAKTDASGQYKLSTQLGEPGKGTTPGEYKVTISSTIDVPTSQMRSTESGELVPITNLQETLPDKYSKPSTTELKATVVVGKNVIDFPLEK